MNWAKARKYNDEKKERALELYNQGNMSQSDVARILNIPRSTVQLWIAEKKYGASETKPEKSEFTAEKKERAIELYRQGNMSQLAIACQLKVSRFTVNMWINEKKRRKSARN